MTSRKERMKVYHGLPKSITDEHTIFYADFDGNLHGINGKIATNMATGYGITEVTGTGNFADVSISHSKELTVDLWINSQNYELNTDSTLFSLVSNQNHRVFFVDYSKSGNGKISCVATNTSAQNGGVQQYVTVDNKSLNHVRFTINDNVMCLYVNGVRRINTNITRWYTDNLKLLIGEITVANGTLTSSYNIKKVAISDLHISNIDRGDYFPTLPQDFIDGKAIVKPRLGQQQIKGDPLYSQTSNLKVPAQTVGNLNKFYDYSTQDSDYTEQCFEKPELRAGHCHTWEANMSKIKIKGLNGEFISGVIDSDTILSTVLSVEKLSNSSARIVCESIDKLQNGDHVNFINKNTLHTGSWVYGGVYGIISEININTNSCVVTASNNHPVIPTVNDLMVEITASSSSPIVKSQDGTTVVGTWSNLGTNEATFTLGTNSNITGKDLYVEYSLTMPMGNSDFPELPHEVETAYNELDLEMKPVNEIVIVDDFKGKITGSTKECPHKCRWYFGKGIMHSVPLGNEYESTNDYTRMSTLDGKCTGANTTSSNDAPQQLFQFNIIEMVERKLGCEIPGVDKVQWLKNNLHNVATISHHGYGKCPSGNKLMLSWYNATNNTWTSSGSVNTSSTVAMIKNSTSSISERIDSNGIINILIYTDATDNTTRSEIQTDYISLEIKLKTDSVFTTLYCENTRAREDSCNPVLIQKETKTVKRYLPSKECFVTECKTNTQSNRTLITNNVPDYFSVDILHKDSRMYLTTYGTGNPDGNIGNDYYKNSANHICNKQLMLYALNKDVIKNELYSFVSRNMAQRIIAVNSNRNNDDIWDATPDGVEDLVMPIISAKPMLIKDNNQLYLYYFTEGMNLRTSNYYFIKVPLPNRPLIK